MKRFVTLVGVGALVLAACGAGASPKPDPTPPSPAPTAATTAPPAPTASPAASVTVHVTFDGQKCTYAGPAVVPEGTRVIWTFANTPAAIADSTRNGAMSIGSDLIIMPVRPGTTWEAIVAGKPAPDGTKGDWTPADWALVDEGQRGGGPSSTVVTEATGAGYLVMCNLYWDYDTGTPFAYYLATLVQVLKA